MSTATVCFVVTALAILRSQHTRASTDEPTTLACRETLSDPLVSFPMKCKAVDDYLFTRFYCNNTHKSHSGNGWTINSIFEIFPTKMGTFIGMISWRGQAAYGKINYEMILDPFKAIGSVLPNSYDMDEIFDLQVRSDTLYLPPFSYTVEEPLFWNFSSWEFGVDRRLILSLSATAAIEDHYPLALPGLAGSSIKKLTLNGSFGTGSNGPLPRLGNLRLLETLSINNNKDTERLLESLNNAENLSFLDLRGNNLTEIPAVIRIMKNLKTLILESQAKDFNIVPDVFKNTLRLTDLVLTGTRIVHWKPNNLSLPFLKTLYLNQCRMKTFDGAQSKFSALEILDLSNNLLSVLTSNAFISLANIDVVHLYGNSLHYLSPNIFSIQQSLSTLDLQSNSFTDWPQLTCEHVGHVILSQNKLTSLNKLGSKIRQVDHLDISYNDISTWDDQNIFVSEYSQKDNIIQFENETSLKVMMYTSMRPDFRKVLQPWVLSVNLSHNRITIFSDAMLYSLSVLKKVDLGGNAIDCGVCQTSFLQKWLQDSRTIVLNVGRDTPLRCHQPAHMNGIFVNAVNFDELCFLPRRYLWLGIGIPVLGVISLVIVGGIGFYYRTELVYLVHLAKIRANSKRKQNEHSDTVYDAFVCYSGKNRKWVMRRLVPLLERRPERYKLCLFDRDFRLGTHIVTNIVDAIDQSRKVIVVLSKEFIVSKWCQWELEMAQHKLFGEDREFLLLVQLETLERRSLPRLLRFLLETRPVVPWPQPETKATILAAAVELRQALGPSLRKRRLAAAPFPDLEPGSPTADERTPFLAN